MAELCNVHLLRFFWYCLSVFKPQLFSEFPLTGNRIERCLSYDEKPLLLFQKLKDAKKNPVFMLKHIKDIRSPIAVAQQKHAARKASSIISQETAATIATHGHQRTASRTGHRPPRLEVQDMSNSNGTPVVSHSQSSWLENAPPPGVDSLRNDDNLPAPNSATAQNSHLLISNMTCGGSTLVAPSPSPSTMSQETIRTRSDVENFENANGGFTSRDVLPSISNGVSYAVAIYPYMAEQNDEFDVVVCVTSSV